MALSAARQGYYGTANTSTAQATRERNVVNALTGASGVVHLILEGGAMLTGTVDTSALGDPNAVGGYGGCIKITDTATPAVSWLVSAGVVLAVGQ